jgi:hypothetical protein
MTRKEGTRQNRYRHKSTLRGMLVYRWLLRMIKINKHYPLRLREYPRLPIDTQTPDVPLAVAVNIHES